MRVLKVGGSTLRTPESARQVIDVIRRARRKGEVVVVVSALYGVTNRLVQLVKEAEAHRLADCRKILHALRAQHAAAIATLIPRAQRAPIWRPIDAGLAELFDLCEGISHLHECSPRTHDRVIGYGELLSSQIVAAALRSARMPGLAVDARSLVVTDAHFGDARVEMLPTIERVRRVQRTWRGKIPVVTGFIAATADGVPTTVGRNGSDYTAALFGAILKAKERIRSFDMGYSIAE